MAMHDADSVTRRQAGDLRMALVAGRTFVLQVAHPAVGAGVGQHSAFRRDPWARLRAIERSGRAFLWRDRAAARDEGDRLRAAHRDIAGVDAAGRRYHALEPRAYGWVHMVFLDTSLAMASLYGPPLAPADQARLFDEWHEGGLLLGLRARDLPRDLADFRARFEAAVADQLEYNPVVAALLDRAHVPPPPPWAAAWPRAWAACWRQLGVWSRWLTLGALPPVYRARLPVTWTVDDQRRFDRLGAAVRAIAPHLPDRLRLSPDMRADHLRTTGDLRHSEQHHKIEKSN